MWFRVDDGFNDHPKTYDATDAAVALWVRAGTWSSRSLTDGFIPTGMLARLSTEADAASKELCDRGLWRRIRGGFQFHDWHDYQPTAEQVKTQRKTNAERQSRWREAQRNAASNAVTNASSNASVTPSVTGVPSRPVPSLGTSVEGERPVARRAPTQRPPERCPKHANDERPPPCGACADARRAVEAWDRATTVDTTAAVRACALCDADGWRWIDPGRRGLGPMAGPGARCDHVRQPVPT